MAGGSYFMAGRNFRKELMGLACSIGIFPVSCQTNETRGIKLSNLTFHLKNGIQRHLLSAPLLFIPTRNLRRAIFGATALTAPGSACR